MIRSDETRQHIALANYIRWAHPGTLFTISPSGMKLPLSVAAKLKAMGYRAGTTDFLILEPRGQWHGLLLEFKTEKGSLQHNQKEFMLEADKRGYKTAVCYGYEAAVQYVNSYLTSAIKEIG